MSFTQILSKLFATPRFWLIVALIAATSWFATQHTPHAKLDRNEPSTVFKYLYHHVVPSKLEVNNHDAVSGDWLLSTTVPGLPAVFDMDKRADGAQLVLTNLQLFQLLAVVLIFVCFAGVPSYLRTGRGDWITKIFAGFALWVRDEMIRPALGKEHAAPLTPYFLTLFFFLLFMNLLGLTPYSSTATASVFVTGAMAMLTLLAMIGGGMIVQGPLAFWKHLVPHVPLPIWPIMFVVEFMGLFVKPVALMIRLFANMTGGHMVVLSFMGLIFFFGMQSPVIGAAASPLALGFAVFIMIIESFVALLQAFIFTQLSLLFVASCLHPEH